MGAQRRKCSESQHTGSHLCPDCCFGRRFVRLSLLPRIQIIPARRLKCPLIRFFRSVFHRAWFLCAFSLCRVIPAFFSLRPFVLRLVLLISIENISYSVRIVNVFACIKFSKQRVLSSCSTIERAPSSFVALGGWHSCRSYGQCRPHLPLTAPSAVPAALYFDRWWIMRM